METISEATFQGLKYFFRRSRIFIILAALLVTFLPLYDYFAMSVALLLIVTLGLMHGATDHILHFNVQTGNSQSLAGFIKRYLLCIAGMSVIWLALPITAFVLFIVLSCYHFGQTQLQYLKLSERSLRKKAIYFVWGLMVLVIIVFSNYQSSIALINSISTSFAIQSDILYLPYIPIIAVGLGMLVMLATKKYSSWKAIGFEIIELFVIYIFSTELDLLSSFGLFFGLWHSLRAIEVQVKKINLVHQFTFKDFLKSAAPFTIISIVGISLLLAASTLIESNMKLEMLFLIAISLVTMPHMVVYESFYNFHDPYKNKKE
ncbi:MAG: hypothetical protein COW03_02205 [Cytophagales bacterium CG12_big_fil_rev_8_21_14_0_65_40_12]|nr:MAG: hypothetical protein COW03_02205 [Cytophagales bacterium CG12_big_fil_rev_8_21_14_0_65_40_12]PIW05160.1 MAG: hypothetical protein COW40_06060 [Cytophagales bacterium CG17_big_fil_post_rev_8_21_14_2_50_40_13]